MSEIPYFLVLTHDIDAMSLVELPFGWTLFGFAYRGVFDNLVQLSRGRLSLGDYLTSLRDVMGYIPARLGWYVDAWARSVGIMLDLERRLGVRSTLFFIPIAGEPGSAHGGMGRAPSNRAAHYEIPACRALLSDLVRGGWEVGVHGVNAWRSLEDARRELAAMREACPEQSRFGIRMHWLYSRPGMWTDLEKAGYAYDSTLGWNDRIGFPEGRYRPFRLTGTDGLTVLPLNIHDVALLDRSKADLDVSTASVQIDHLLDEARQHHAVVTLLWHNTSFVAPRFWGKVYERVIERARRDGAEILTAAMAVERFGGG